ncbi:MAG: tetratricopeptide repeat protein [Myxococcales bacterium]|nr:tetratricopeptide repeat protein [Myxococcales bacterium]
MTAAASRSASSGRWLHGPTTDLLFGCGVWYFFAFALLCAYGEQIRGPGGMVFLPVLMLLFGTPHYGATLLRVYDQREDRAQYRFFALWATVAVVAMFGVGVWVPVAGSAILTLYMTWSPWHYAGQNYGLAVMFLRRRGVEISPRAKRLFYGTFFLSFLLTFLLAHGTERVANFTPLLYTDAGYQFLSIGLPQPYTGWLTYGVLAAYLGCVGGSVWLLARGARSLGDLGPSLLLVGSQALWFVIPFGARYWRVGQEFGPLSIHNEGWYFLWIAIAHSVQYLWVTSSFAEGRSDWKGMAPYLGKTLLAGACVWALPAVLFSPDLLGRVSYDAGLAVLIASAVNIHHFILDGAIWKLRDGRVARLLMRRRATERDDAVPTEGGWVRPVVWATGAACVAMLFVGYWEHEVRLQYALHQKDTEKSGAILDRLRFIGRESAEGRASQAELLYAEGRPGAAELAYRRSLGLHPKAETWFSLGKLQYEQRRYDAAIESLEAAAALRPHEDAVYYYMGRAWLEQGRTAEAVAAFERAAELAPTRGIYRKMLEKARSAGA